ncbi:MAG: YkgJ family cysteine cluster protein [Candidatus Methanoperedens sp.]|nr:YkgJ family cysteine cluster protein [Candidatus Methanoperedens sp.]
MKMNCDIENCKSRCCHNCAVLTEDEISNLILNVRKKYTIELEPRKFFKKVKGEFGTYYAIKMIKGQCIFLNKENRCRIYLCRPTLCELYPVIDIDMVDKRCPIANMLPPEMLSGLKRRYAQEIDGNIKAEQTFLFV